MQKLNRWLWFIAIAMLSAILVLYAYDIEQGTPIGLSSTQSGRQEMLMGVADVLGFKGSMVVAVFSTFFGLYYAIRKRAKK